MSADRAPLATLRYQVASDPRDVSARVALARLEFAAGRPGAAFEHLEFVATGSTIGAKDRALLAQLYGQRFAERLALGDSAAYRDAETARRLDPNVALTPGQRAEGYFAAALGGLRRGNPWGWATGVQFLRKAAALAPDDPRLAAVQIAELHQTDGDQTEAVQIKADQIKADQIKADQIKADQTKADQIKADQTKDGQTEDGQTENGQTGGDSETAALRTNTDQSDLADVGRAALWLHRGGARRAALTLSEAYVHRGGRDREVLQAFVTERAWWGGARGRPPLLLLRELTAAGANPCPLAHTPASLGCGAALGPAAEAGGAVAESIWHRAEQRFWRTANPEQAAAWALLALQRWLDGQGPSWTTLLRRRVDVGRAAGANAVPDYVAPTLLRTSGRPRAAAGALTRLLTQVRRGRCAKGVVGPCPGTAMTPGQQALVVAEAAVQGRSAAVIDALRARLPEAGRSGWQVAVMHARARGDWPRVAGLLREQPEYARAYLQQSGDLGPLAWGFDARIHAWSWWWRVLDGDVRLVAGRTAQQQQWQAMWAPPPGWRVSDRIAVTVPAGVLVPIPASPDRDVETTRAALVAIAEAYAREPAVADRLAGEYAYQAVSAAQHGPLIANLFAGLGDADRALRWWERVAAESPQHPDYALALGIATVAAGKADRYRDLVTTAAARSGDAGTTTLHAAGHLLRRGRPLAAVALGRRALALTPAGERLSVLALLATATTRLQREPDAAAMRAAWTAEVPAAFRGSARAQLAAGLTSGAADGADGAHAEVMASDGTDAWQTGAVAVHAARLDRLDPESEAYSQAVAALLALAVTAPPAQAHAAFSVLLQAFERMGAKPQADAVRAARRALVPVLPPLLPGLPDAD